MGFFSSISKAFKKTVGSVVGGIGDLAEGAVSVGDKIVAGVVPIAITAAATYYGGPLGGAASGALFGGNSDLGNVSGFFDNPISDVIIGGVVGGFVGSYFEKDDGSGEYEWREGDITGVGAVDPAMAGRPGWSGEGVRLVPKAQESEEYGLLLAHNWAYDAGETAEVGNETFDFGMSVGTMIGDLLGNGTGEGGGNYRTAEGKPTTDQQEVIESVLKAFTPDKYEDTTPAIRSLHAIQTEDVAWTKELQTANADTPEYTTATNKSAWEASGMSLAKLF